jgi:hypothetical protein
VSEILTPEQIADARASFQMEAGHDYVPSLIASHESLRAQVQALTDQPESIDARLTSRLITDMLKASSGALKSYVSAHGPTLDGSGIGSAAKRVTKAVWTLLKTHPDCRTVRGQFPDEAQRHLSECQQECSAKSERIANLEEQVQALTASQRERAAQLTAHRACCNEEHDPAHGKISGFCVVCGVPWPCVMAQPDRLTDLARKAHDLIAGIETRLREIGHLSDSPDANITGAIHGIIDGYVSYRAEHKALITSQAAIRQELAEVREAHRADNRRLVDARQEQVNRAVAAEAALIERTEERKQQDSRLCELEMLLNGVALATTGDISDFEESFTVIRDVRDLREERDRESARATLLVQDNNALSIQALEQRKRAEAAERLAAEREAENERLREALAALRQVRDFYLNADSAWRLSDGFPIDVVCRAIGKAEGLPAEPYPPFQGTDVMDGDEDRP